MFAKTDLLFYFLSSIASIVTSDSVFVLIDSAFDLKPAFIFFSVKYTIIETKVTKATIVIAVIATIANITIRFSLILSLPLHLFLACEPLSTHV